MRARTGRWVPAGRLPAGRLPVGLEPDGRVPAWRKLVFTPSGDSTAAIPPTTLSLDMCAPAHARQPTATSVNDPTVGWAAACPVIRMTQGPGRDACSGGSAPGRGLAQDGCSRYWVAGRHSLHRGRRGQAPVHPFGRHHPADQALVGAAGSGRHPGSATVPDDAGDTLQLGARRAPGRTRKSRSRRASTRQPCASYRRIDRHRRSRSRTAVRPNGRRRFLCMVRKPSIQGRGGHTSRNRRVQAQHTSLVRSDPQFASCV
jgi:hypothetical protein